MSMNHFDVGIAIKDGIIDQDLTLNFDLNKYYDSVMNKKSPRDLER